MPATQILEKQSKTLQFSFSICQRRKSVSQKLRILISPTKLYFTKLYKVWKNIIIVVLDQRAQFAQCKV